MVPVNNLSGDVIVVGGSLTGLATGIGLARAGVAVRVYEQNTGEERGGTGLGVESRLLSATTGVDAREDHVIPKLPVVNEGYRETSTWLAIYRWLKALADVTPRLTIADSSRVDRVWADGSLAYVVGTSGADQASIVLGADGYRSVVRSTLAPSHPAATYSGFVLWRGLVDESALPPNFAQSLLRGGRTHHIDAARLVMYRVPGPNGETAAGSRSITFAWYDGSRSNWLRERGFLRRDEAMGSVPSNQIDSPLRQELLRLAKIRWHGAAAQVAIHALEHGIVFGTPLVEYLPEQMSRGRIAILGDAAHVASPMVGAGLALGLMDGAALITAVREQGGVAGEAGMRALEQYDRVRLRPNREHVLESFAQTRALLRSASGPSS